MGPFLFSLCLIWILVTILGWSLMADDYKFHVMIGTEIPPHIRVVTWWIITLWPVALSMFLVLALAKFMLYTTPKSFWLTFKNIKELIDVIR